MDREAPDAQLRPAVRLLQRLVPAQQVPASRFRAVARDFARSTTSRCWTDLNPRLGVVVRSVRQRPDRAQGVPGPISRRQLGAGIASANNPIVTSVNNANRTWNDANGNYVPDCDLTNFAANGECGPIDNSNFGKNNPNATRYADEVLRGFTAPRDLRWDLSTEVQHQLRPGVSVTGGYYRNWAGNFRATDNLRGDARRTTVRICITAPVDARLPGGGGYQVCGLYDVAPAKFGQVNNLVTKASDYLRGGGRRHLRLGASACAGQATAPPAANRTSSASASTRGSAGIQLGGGVDTGRTVNDNCFVIDSPQQLLNCRVVTPFKAQTQVKVFGSYPLPADFVVSGTLQNLSGAPIEANYPAPQRRDRAVARAQPRGVRHP